MKVLLTGEDCPGCKIVKKKLEDEIENGEIVEVDVKSEIGSKLVKDRDIKKIPRIVGI